MHRRIINPVLDTLDGERAAYFSAVVDAVESDPRTQAYPNIVFLLLKETLALLPAYLDKAEFIDALFAFVAKHHGEMEEIVFDRDYVYDPTLLKDVTNAFVVEIVELTMHHYDAGDIDPGEPAVQKFTWPYRAEDLIDPDDPDAEEILERLKDRPPYTGPERRKRR